MDKDALYLYLKKHFDIFKTDRSEWLEMAKEAYGFYHGLQWDKETEQALCCKGRPALTFNHIKPLINSVVGSEINNRRNVKFVPREVGDIKPNELLNSISDWFRSETQGEMIDTTIFKDSLITGMGWAEVTLDFSSSPKGKPCIKRLDPLKMVWDTNASQDNLLDARFLFYINTLPLETLRRLFPNVDDSEFNYCDSDSNSKISINEDDIEYSNNRSKYSSQEFGTVIEARYKTYEEFVDILDPFTNQERTISKKEFLEIQKIYGVKLEGIAYEKEIIKRAFLGSSKILEDVSEPLAPSNNFGWICLTGDYDNISRYYYGLIRALKDPQTCINKFFSESVYNFNAQSKGGLLVEDGAVDDLDEFKDTINHIDTITIVREGGLSKIMPKPVGQINSALHNLLGFASGQINGVTGISQEFLGTREVNQPGILEAQRKQSSLNILAPLFNNLKLYHRQQGEIILYLIQNFLSDGRLIRILGDNDSRYIELTSDDIVNKEYDIIIDDEPLTLNRIERNFQIIMQLLPMLQQVITPDMLIEFLRLSPLPSNFVDRLSVKYAEAQKNNQEQQQNNIAQQQMMQQQINNRTAVKEQLENNLKAAEIAKTQAQAFREMTLAKRNGFEV